MAAAVGLLSNRNLWARIDDRVKFFLPIITFKAIGMTVFAYATASSKSEFDRQWKEVIQPNFVLTFIFTILSGIVLFLVTRRGPPVRAH